MVGSYCELPLPPTLFFPTSRNILDVWRCRWLRLVGTYAYTASFFFHRGSFVLVVYSAAMLNSYLRERLARGFCYHRGMYSFLSLLFSDSTILDPHFSVELSSGSFHQTKCSDGPYIMLALDNSQPLRPDRQRQHRRRMDFLRISGNFHGQEHASKALGHCKSSSLASTLQ